MILKMNSLTDEKLIERLYAASHAGVKIDLIIRGMCCLIPGIKGVSEHIRVRSIVDRFLEHARVWIFGNDGNERIYLSSADMMPRNLDSRVEVAFPLEDPDIRKEVRDMIDIQLKDHVKAREINAGNDNRYIRDGEKKHCRTQYYTYQYLKNKT